MVAADENNILNHNKMEEQTSSSLSIEGVLEDFKCWKDEKKFIPALENLVMLASNSDEKLKLIAEEVDVKFLFDILNDQQNVNKTVFTHLCKLLKMVLGKYDPVEIVSKYSSYIVSSFKSGREEYHLICLHQVLRLGEAQKFSTFMSNPDIIIFAVQSLGCSDIGTSSIAKKVLDKLFDMDENTDWLFSSEIYNACFDLIEKQNSTVRFRVYEVFLDFLKKYPEYLGKFNELDSFNKLMADLFDTNDVLSQLNALELVTQIALTGQQGMEFIEKKGIMDWLRKVVDSADPLTQFLLPGAIKCFGILAANNPATIIPKHKSLVDAVFTNLTNDDPSLRCLCAETLCFISSKTDALKQLYKDADIMKKSLQLIGKLVASAGENETAKTSILESISTMFAHDPLDFEVSSICEKLFHHLSNEPVKFLLEYTQQPFLGIRNGVLKIYRSVSVFSWVEQDMALCPGFLEYLLNRRTETEKEGRELKYDIIKNLSVSNSAQENIGLGYWEKIVTYAKQGPFYSESEVAVTYEQA